MKILVYEHVSGGGFTGKPMPTSILSEGFSMLRAIIADFKAAGHSVTTVLDSRLAALNPPVEADSVVSASPLQDTKKVISELSESTDAAYVIAPESNQILHSLVASIEHAGVSSLNCRSSAVGSLSDKLAVFERAKELGLPTPETILLNAHDTNEEIKRAIRGSLRFPLIVKPVDGVGCAGLSVINNEQQVAAAVANAIGELAIRHLVVQELICGIAVSVSLLSTGSDVLPVSLNGQDVALMPPAATSTYNGGQVPIDSLLKREAFAAAETIVKSFQGLRGYVGVDMVFTEKEVVIIEVNPRLTTSYVGVRKTLGINFAKAIIDAIFENKLPAINQSSGYAVFSKVKAPKPTVAALQKTYRINQVISPPFPAPDSETAYALVLSHGATVKKATAGFQEAKKSLCRIISLEGN